MDSVCFCIYKYSVFIFIENPVVEKLIIEFVKHELIVSLMKFNSIKLISSEDYSPESNFMVKKESD